MTQVPARVRQPMKNRSLTSQPTASSSDIRSREAVPSLGIYKKGSSQYPMAVVRPTMSGGGTMSSSGSVHVSAMPSDVVQSEPGPFVTGGPGWKSLTVRDQTSV